LHKLSGHDAGRKPDVLVPVSQGDLAVGSSGIITADIEPPLIVVMGDLAVELDDERELVVEDVAILAVPIADG
jgi:hypothetical protein